MSALRVSLRHARLVAQHTVGAAVHHRVLHGFVLLAVGLVVGARWLRDFNFGADELKFLVDCGSGAMSFFGAAVVVVTTAQLFGGALESGAAATLFAKSLRRSEFVVGNGIAVFALAALFCGLMTGVLISLVAVRQHEWATAMGRESVGDATISYAALALMGLGHWLKLVVLAALTLLIATFARSQFLTIAGGALLLVIGHLRALSEHAANHDSTFVGRLLATGVTAVFPDFGVFTPATNAADVARMMLYALGYVAVGCGLAVYSFRHRDL